MIETTEEFVKRFRSLLEHNNATEKDGFDACERLEQQRECISELVKSAKRFIKHGENAGLRLPATKATIAKAEEMIK